MSSTVSPLYCRAEMYVGYIACCPWCVVVSMLTGQTDGRTPDRYIMLSTCHGDCNKGQDFV